MIINWERGNGIERSEEITTRRYLNNVLDCNLCSLKRIVGSIAKNTEVVMIYFSSSLFHIIVRKIMAQRPAGSGKTSRVWLDDIKKW